MNYVDDIFDNIARDVLQPIVDEVLADMGPEGQLLTVDMENEKFMISGPEGVAERFRKLFDAKMA